MFLPEKSNTQIYHADAKMRVCPRCDEPLAIYAVKFSRPTMSRTLNGYMCVKCDTVCLERTAINEIVDYLDQ